MPHALHMPHVHRAFDLPHALHMPHVHRALDMPHALHMPFLDDWEVVFCLSFFLPQWQPAQRASALTQATTNNPFFITVSV